VVTVALASSLVLKTGAGNFYGCNLNATSVGLWFMLFDAAAAPADGAVTPKAVWNMPVPGTISVAEQPPVSFTTGAVVVASSTGPLTKTASATALIACQVD
jgi:hypothetical protein